MTDEAWGFADVVGIGLERHAEHRHGLALERAATARSIRPAMAIFRSLVHRLHPLDQGQRRARFSRRADHSRDILWEAGAAITRARMQEFVADTPVGADRRATSWMSAPTASHKSAISLTKLIFMARKALARVLGELGRFAANKDERRIAQGERPVEPLHHGARPIVVAADQHAVGMGKVVDRRALAQELRVRADREIGVGPQYS